MAPLLGRREITGCSTPSWPRGRCTASHLPWAGPPRCLAAHLSCQGHRPTRQQV